MTYISREAAYKTLTEYYHHSSGVQHTALREALNRVPTADVVEVRHGEWEQDGQYKWRCSVCQARNCYAYAWDDDTMDYTKLQDNYCPKCGADMRKAVEIDQVKEEEQ